MEPKIPKLIEGWDSIRKHPLFNVNVPADTIRFFSNKNTCHVFFWGFLKFSKVENHDLIFWLGFIGSHLDVSENSGTPKLSILIPGFFHYFHHPFWGTHPYFWKHPSHLFGEWRELRLMTWWPFQDVEVGPELRKINQRLLHLAGGEGERGKARRMDQNQIWMKHTVDGGNPANQLRLVDIPWFFRVLYIPGGAGFLPSTVWYRFDGQGSTFTWPVVATHIFFYVSPRKVGKMNPFDSKGVGSTTKQLLKSPQFSSELPEVAKMHDCGLVVHVQMFSTMASGRSTKTHFKTKSFRPWKWQLFYNCFFFIQTLKRSWNKLYRHPNLPFLP